MLEKIKQLCAEKRITIAELERATNLSNGAISKWEFSIPRVDSAKRVADYFGITIDSLIDDTR